MSDNFKGYLGLDGKRYDSWLDKTTADRVVENSLKQTELLQKQVEQKEKELKQAKQLEMQRRLDAEEQQENERMLRLFDKISIPYDIFTKFRENLFKYEITDKDREKVEKTILNLDISDQEKEEYKRLLPVTIKHIEDGSFKTRPWLAIKRHFTEVLPSPSEKYNNTKEYKKLQDFINNRSSFKKLKVADFEIFEDNYDMIFWYNEVQKENQKLITSVIITSFLTILVVFLILMQINDINFFKISTFALYFISVCRTLYCLNIKNSNIGTLANSINKYLKGTTDNQKEKQEKSILDKTTVIEKEYKKLQKEKVDQRLNQFYDFRIHHYNLEIETILYSSGLVEECEENEFSFKTIDKNNVLGEGTIEDYFFYFSNYKIDN